MGGAWISDVRSDVVFEKKVADDVFAQAGVTSFDPLFTAVRSVLPPGAYIAGGYPAMLLAGLRVYDIDIWFKNDAAYRATQTALRALVRRPQIAQYGIAEASKNSFTEFKISRQGLPLLQIALNAYHSFTGPDHVIDSFDFTAAQVALDGVDMWVGPTTLADLQQKTLEIHRVQPTLIHRVPKYVKKGFQPSDAALLVIAQERAELVQPIQVAANTALLKEIAVPDTMPERNAAPPPQYTRTKP